MEDKKEITEYTIEIQKNLLEYMVSSEEYFTRCQNILSAEYFDKKLKPVMRYILKYTEEYNALPDPHQIKAETGIVLMKMSNIDERNMKWFLDLTEEFCRHRAFEIAVYSAPEEIEKGNYDDALKRMKEAVLVSLQKDLGTDYFKDPKGRLQSLRDNNGVISTGWKAVDEKLFGGFNRGEFSFFAGGPGSGKSLFLQNIGLNWVEMGLNVAYITLELSEELISLRLDAMISGMGTKQVFRSLDDVDAKVRMAGKKAGKYQIKYMNPAATPNDIRAYLKEYEIQTGIKPDAVIVDYLDLLSPNNQRVNPSDLFVKDKYVSEELRALANDWNCLMVSASQLNRSAVQEQEHDHTHIAGGISKINTADTVMSIFTSAPMRERGEYRLQFLKTRSSSGVDSKIDLAFDPETLRITDKEDYESGNGHRKNASEIADEIKSKRKIGISKEPTINSIEENLNRGAQLKGLLAEMRKN